MLNNIETSMEFLNTYSLKRQLNDIGDLYVMETINSRGNANHARYCIESAAGPALLDVVHLQV